MRQHEVNTGRASTIELAVPCAIFATIFIQFCKSRQPVDNSWDNPGWVWKTPALRVDKYNGILAGVLQITFAP
jgi:hypothetical protein